MTKWKIEVHCVLSITGAHEVPTSPSPPPVSYHLHHNSEYGSYLRVTAEYRFHTSGKDLTRVLKSQVSVVRTSLLSTPHN